MDNFQLQLNCIEQTEIIDDNFFFWGEGSEQYIFKDGIIRKDAYKQILNLKSFAEVYLEHIKAGHIDFEWQTQHLVILGELENLIKGGRWDYKSLASLFREAMISLADKSGQLLTEIQRPEEIEKAVELGYQYGKFNGLVVSTVAHARRAAVQGMIHKFSVMHSAEGGCKGDLYGNYSFELSRPRIDGIIPWLPRKYIAEGDRVSAEIHQTKDGTWRLQYYNLLPFNDINWLMLAVETYKAAIPVFEHALEIDANVYWELT